MFRILFVDDMEDIRDLFAMAVTAYQLPWQVDLAANGRMALNLYASARTVGSPYDLIVWDISMPDFSGLRAAQLIREAAACHTKFVIYSAQDDEQSRQAAHDVGALAYLVKGAVPVQQLLEEISRVLES